MLQFNIESEDSSIDEFVDTLDSIFYKAIHYKNEVLTTSATFKEKHYSVKQAKKLKDLFIQLKAVSAIKGFYTFMF